MGKIWKSFIMMVTCIAPHNSQQPWDVTYRLQRVRPSGISTFVHPATSSLLSTYCLAWGGLRMPLSTLIPTIANAGFIIISLTGSGDTFIWWQEGTIRAEQGCQCHQMLLKLLSWVSTIILLQECHNNVDQTCTQSGLGAQLLRISDTGQGPPRIFSGSYFF